ncbi:hypothetical protein CI15_07100 [Paraburkholderia monticola]|uniref:Uncharacterized protein n=1 Tax=Paraburkholderia monticola TaxID=1399968 RepID=A0A149PY03_9BURK|nr:hypothetical protein CI15_07100 [Paraburkholderia monticola]
MKQLTPIVGQLDQQISHGFLVGNVHVAAHLAFKRADRYIAAFAADTCADTRIVGRIVDAQIMQSLYDLKQGSGISRQGARNGVFGDQRQRRCG